MLLPPILVPVLILSGVAYDYHAVEIIEHTLCTISEYNGPGVVCLITEIKDAEYQEVDCNQVNCKCRYTAASFTQTCTYNTSHSFVRVCKGYDKNCTLTSNYAKNQGAAMCRETYGECDVVSERPESRFAAGYPQYNPPTCYPGFRAARLACNSSSTMCVGEETIRFDSDARMTYESCSGTCTLEQTRCTNFTKSCSDPSTSWDERYVASRTDEQCDVTTRKCNEVRTVKRLPLSTSYTGKRSNHKAPAREILVTSHDCSATTNLSSSLNFCRTSIWKNMKYKAECQLYGVRLTNYLINSVYSANSSVPRVVDFLSEQWETVVKDLCRLDCFRTLTRELRFCVQDLPVQNLLPGINQAQLQYLMYRAEDFLCVSITEDKVKESCVVYLNPQSSQSLQVRENMTESCSSELARWDKGGELVSCSSRCRNHLLKEVVSKNPPPGCCLAELMKFKRDSSPWIEMLSPDIFTRNLLLNIAQQCGIVDQLSTCDERDAMHPAVIFVLAVIGVFSVALVSGVTTFIVIFYRQMEYEGYKKGFLQQIMT